MHTSVFITRLMHSRMLAFVVGLLIAITPASANKAHQGVIAIVINKSYGAAVLKLRPENLNPIFWRKQRYWPKGIPIKPVNLEPEHPIRLSFSETILGSLPSEQIDYWNGQYFNGIKPPYAVKSEEAVLRYVAKTKGAIGYIDACHIDDRITPVFWITSNTIMRSAPANIICE